MLITIKIEEEVYAELFALAKQLKLKTASELIQFLIKDYKQNYIFER